MSAPPPSAVVRRPSWWHTRMNRLVAWQRRHATSSRRNAILVALALTALTVLGTFLPDEYSILIFTVRCAILGLLGFVLLRTFWQPRLVSGLKYSHGPAATRLTVESGSLEPDEVIRYDRRPHWGEAIERLFNRRMVLAIALVLMCLLTSWVGVSLGIFILKVLILLAASAWIAREEASWFWLRYVITNTRVYIILRPPAFFGGSRVWELRLVKIETVEIEKPWLFRLLGLNAAHLVVDAPGQRDDRFNNMRWVRAPQDARQYFRHVA